MAQSVTAGGSTTTTYYIAGLEEQANISGGSSTLTKYYSVPGVISAVSVGGTLSVLASDGLGSMSEALSSTSAAATSQQLYGPYGGLRYATGNMPTAKGYTGQYADAASSGLDYYNARYYDPLVGQFTSADNVADGLNRYGYVAGNPETATDPSGHRICNGGAGCGGDGGDGGDGGRLPPPPGGGGGHGGSGGKGGNGTGSSASGDPCDNPQSAACRSFKEKAWESDQKDARDKKLADERRNAGILLLVGFLLNVLADVIGIWKSHSAAVKLEDYIDLSVNFATALTFIPYITGVNAQWGPIYAIESGVHFLAGIARNALAALHDFGVFAEAAADVAADTVTTAAGGIPGLLMQIVETIAGGVANNLLTAGGHFLTSAGYALLADYNNQESEDIGAWCASHADTCAPRSSYGL